MHVNNEIQDSGLVAGVVVARGIQIKPASAELQSALDALVKQRKEEVFPPDSLKESVRGLLKTGGFKPTGRNKPASEYLAQSAREDRFPSINNLVDVNNLISLESGLPISLLNLDVFGNALRLRFGREGERYVFNNGGQEIELKGLICVCNAESDEPLGNPVKDSMTGKLKDATTSVVGVIYCPCNAYTRERLEQYVQSFADWLKKEGGASSIETFVA